MAKNKNMFAMSRACLAVVAAIALPGCVDYKAMERKVDAEYHDAQKAVERATPIMPSKAEIDEKAKYFRKVNKPFLAVHSVDAPSSDRLPERFNHVTINQPGNYTLREAAQIITEATGIPVTLSEDVNTVNAAAQGATTASAGNNTQIQAMQSAAFMSQQFPITFNFTDMPLESILDSVGAAAGGLNYDYKFGRISFFRFETRAFHLYAPTYNPVVAMTMGTNSQMQAGTTGTPNAQQTGANSSSFSVNFNTSLNAWQEAVDAIKNSILSPTGRMASSKTANLLSMTDGRRQVQQAEKFIDSLNAVYRRQIAVHIEAVTLTFTNNSEFGINWNVVLSKLNAAGNNTTFTMTSPSNFVNVNAASAGVNVIKQINGTLGLTGTQAIVQALESVGKVVKRNSFDTIAMNRRVTPVASFRSTGYVASTTPATAVAGGTGGVPGLTPGNVSFGFGMALIPTIQSDNTLTLDFGLLQSDLLALIPQSSGTGANQQTIELPDQIAQQFAQSMNVETGNTLVISGLEQDTHQSNKRTLGGDLSPGVGGMFTGSTSRQTLIVLITPVIQN